MLPASVDYGGQSKCSESRTTKNWMNINMIPSLSNKVSHQQIMPHFIKYAIINSQKYIQRKKMVSWLSERENPYSENMNQTDLCQLTCTRKLLCRTHKADGIPAKHQHSLRPPPYHLDLHTQNGSDTNTVTMSAS